MDYIALVNDENRCWENPDIKQKKKPLKLKKNKKK